MTRLLTTLACLALLPGAALAKPHHHARAHHKTAHHKPARHHRAAAETNGLHVAGYVHPPSSTGGALAIEHADGRVDLAFVGENTKVRCGTSADGPFTACSLRNLIVGTPVADADHGPNDRGYDLWKSVDLVTDHPLTDPAPDPGDDGGSQGGSGDQGGSGGDQGGSGDQTTPPPAPEQHPAPPPVAVIDSYDPGTRTLAVHRLNNDEKPTGHVADGVSVSCVYVKDGKLVNATPCDTDVLTPGTQLAGYAVTTAGGVTFTKIYVLLPGS